MLSTAITKITEHGPLYGEHLATDLARCRQRFESVAEHLWSGRALADDVTWRDGKHAGLGRQLDEIARLHPNVHIRQLFQHLLSNSIKYRQEDVPPRITVSAVSRGDMWEFGFSDNGIGVREEDRERIFEVFQRGVSDGRPGTGIGLAVCHKIVELHGGEIWVETQSGPGATFRFTLPSAQ